MGESKLKLAKREEILLSCAGVQTEGGRVQVRWESQSAATPMGQLAYFIEFLTLTGLWSRWRDSCPLSYVTERAEQSRCAGYLDAVGPVGTPALFARHGHGPRPPRTL